MKKLLLLTPVFLGVIAFALPSHATLFTWEFNVEFSEDGVEPAGDPPWLTATFDDKDTMGSVFLTLTAGGLTGDAEHVKLWFFNFDGDLNTLSFSEDSRTGLFDFDVYADIAKSPDSFKADGDGLYDIGFTFNDTDGPGTKFGNGDELTILIKGLGITADSFNCESSPDGGEGTFLSAAHVGGIGTNDDSGWVAPSIPDASAVFLLGSACLIGFAGLRRKFKK